MFDLGEFKLLLWIWTGVWGWCDWVSLAAEQTAMIHNESSLQSVLSTLWAQGLLKDLES